MFPYSRLDTAASAQVPEQSYEALLIFATVIVSPSIFPVHACSGTLRRRRAPMARAAHTIADRAGPALIRTHQPHGAQS
jgi:hypothetical protein